MPLPIEGYAALGDGQTAALVGLDGSIDWLCLPRFDSAACFAALLGGEEHGRWLIGPDADPATVETTRSYVGDSAVLVTTHRTPDGVVTVTDLMPVGDQRADLVRRVECVEGSVALRHEWVVRLDYGRIRPWVHRESRDGQDLIVAVAGPDKLVLRGPRLPRARDGRHVDTFTVERGESMTFSTTWVPSHERVPELLAFDDRIEHTIREHQEWADGCDYDGRYRDAVVRSLVTLRGLTHASTGGIVAAATTSLPECFGGERNWDYRYCWLRDASLTLEALLTANRVEEAQRWRGWLLRAVAGDPQDLQILYTVDGGRHLPERELDHLPGYADSRPVRIGNAAVGQRQSDVLGEVMIALHRAREAGIEETRDSWALQRALVQHLSEHWDRPDHGLWEIRGSQQRFTHSRVMVWAAFDRAVRAVEEFDLPGPVDGWRELRDRVREQVLTEGFDEASNSFTQHDATDEVDASLLMIPLVGFLPGDDPRVVGTLERVERELLRDGLVLRYRTTTGLDGLPGDEHPFLACSFWLVSAYVAAGRRDDAERLMDRLVGLANDVGLLSEEYDVGEGRMAGNFPQAFSHLALVGAAVSLRG